jgi:CRISPR-associated protein Cas2
MRIIVVYDTAAERNAKALRTCRRYLHWVQRSVFEGTLSEAQLRQLRRDLTTILDPTDSVIIYRIDHPATIHRHILGRELGNTDPIL